MLRDILRETPAYQEILEEGREEGLEKGLEEGLAKGREQEHRRYLQSLREMLLKIVQTRFPRLKTSAKGLL